MAVPIIIATSIVILMLGVGAIMTPIGTWYRNLRKPVWNPPDWVFGPAWTVILSLAACAGVVAWANSSEAGMHQRIAVLFGVNIILHMLWSPLFFNLRRPDWALVEVLFLWLSILALMIGLAPISLVASLLLLPYLLWVAFATILNLVIVRMNAPFASEMAD